MVIMHIVLLLWTALHTFASNLPPPPLYTLPVVVHVIHTGTPVGAPDNPTDADIHAVLNLLNTAFRRDGPIYGGADIEMHFALAIIDPDCTLTSGINRVDGSVFTDYPTGGITYTGVPGSVDEILVKGLSRWPNADYINIWIVNKIDGDPNWPGGYAYFPEFNLALTDGIVLQASMINGSNKTIVHEMGHYFYLYHTFGNAWGDCIAESDCTVDGDFLCDTENCRFTLDCSETINPCSGEPWEIADPILGYTVLNNHMGFTDCAWMFSDDQKSRMHDALLQFRPGLISSAALQSTDLLQPMSACMPIAVHGLSPFYGIERVEFGPLNVYSNTSEADAAFYVDRTCNQRVELIAGTDVLLRITGSYENWQQIRVYLDLNHNGVFDLPDEVLLSQDGGIVWETIHVPIVDAQVLCTPLRLRVVADHPTAPEPGPCAITGTSEEGTGQVEDYTVVIKPRVIESISSGNWNNPDMWDCQCVPGDTDLVRIASGHTITVTHAMGALTCFELELQGSGAVLNVDGVLHIVGDCQ